MGKSLSLSLSLLSFFSFIPLYFSFLLSAPPLLAVFLYLTLPLFHSLSPLFLSLSHSTSLSFSLTSLSFFISLYLSFILSLLSFFLYVTLALFPLPTSLSHTHYSFRFFSLPFPSLSPSLFPPSLIN